MTSRVTRRSASLLRMLALPGMAALAGCATPRALPPPVTPYDYRDRHPVVLAEAPQVIDLFPAVEKGSLDSETRGRIQQFAARYRAFGHGDILVLAPVGSAGAYRTATRVGLVRRELAAAGLGSAVTVGEYPVVDQKLAAPIRLSFQALKARVANKCGEWPRDLASGSSLDGWQNESYWNFGCATQSTLSAQIDDPRDLAGPRGEQPSDIEMRMRPIRKLRDGVDPSTNWRLQGTSIGGVGG